MAGGKFVPTHRRKTEPVLATWPPPGPTPDLDGGVWKRWFVYLVSGTEVSDTKVSGTKVSGTERQNLFWLPGYHRALLTWMGGSGVKVDCMSGIR